ncbi:MAG: WecB/TagA/CpsF family glycosyltransferase [Clostridium sp.]|nr:WecB/TagA/CpsF family glycosyltransferase [Clostridium sp.]
MVECNILGVNIDVLNMKKAVGFIENNLNEIKGQYICVSNVHTTVMASDNEHYRTIQNSAFLRLPDGKPLSVVSKFKGFKEAERVTGPDLMGEIFKESETRGYTHYFYGSKQETLKQLQINLSEKYPKLKIKGFYSPPFKELTSEENKRTIKTINEVKPDFLWVGLGAPKQEYWMYNHKNQINSLMIGVGAGFDYFAGNIKRAPRWMQKLSLEWFYRLCQQPTKLMKRYMVTNVKFMYLIINRWKLISQYNEKERR